MATALELRRVSKKYGEVEVVKELDLAVNDGSFTALVGPSGCGKSTLLRMIAGLEDITGGEILIRGRVVNGLSPKARNIAMVFQNYALYPHMTVRKNIGLNLTLAGLPRDEVDKRVREAAALLSLENLLDRRPNQLSGGQRQRVAMGRAIVRNPDVFLFDEPLSNLDAKLRVQMRSEIKQFHARTGKTTIYVTHDQVEAMTLADRVVVLDGGRIMQSGPPMELYRTPANRFVAGFIGSPGMNFFPGRIAPDGKSVECLAVRFPLSPAVAAAGAETDCGIRPEALTFCAEGTPGATTATVIDLEPTGATTYVTVDCCGHRLLVAAPPESHPAPGARVGLKVPARHLIVFDRASGAVINRDALRPAA